MRGSRLPTRSLAEGALLATVAVILALSGIYLPLVGALAMLAWPVPVMLAQIRQGMRLSVLTVVVTGVLLSSLIGLVPALALVVTLGPLGIAMGEAFRRRLTPWASLGVASAAALVSHILGFGVTLLLMGQNPLELYRTAFEESIAMATSLYGRIGLDAGAILAPLQEQAAVLLGTLLPATLVIAAVMTAAINYGVATVVLRRLGYRSEPFPLFARWQLPPYAPMLYIAGVGLVYLDRGRGGAFNVVGGNLAMAAQMAFMVIGLSVAYWWLTGLGLSRVFKVVLLVYVFVLPALVFVAMLAGVLDSLFDWRKLRLAGEKGEAGP